MTTTAADPRCFACRLPDCNDGHPACPVGAEERAAANAKQAKDPRRQTPEAIAKRRAYLNEYQRRNRARITELQRQSLQRKAARKAGEGAGA